METEQSSILGNLTWKYVNKNFQIDRVHQWMQFRFVSLLIFFSLPFLLSCAIFRVFFSIRCHSPAIVFRILSFDSFTNSQTKSFTFRQTTIIYFFPPCFTTRCTFMDFWWMCIEVRFRWELGTIVVCHFNQMEWWHVTECNWYTMIDGSILEIWLSRK